MKQSKIVLSVVTSEATSIGTHTATDEEEVLIGITPEQAGFIVECMKRVAHAQHNLGGNAELIIMDDSDGVSTGTTRSRVTMPESVLANAVDSLRGLVGMLEDRNLPEPVQHYVGTPRAERFALDRIEKVLKAAGWPV